MKSSRLLASLAILTASVVTSVASAAELRYRIQPIESGDPALFLLIADLNNRGEAAGLTFDSAGNQHAIRWRNGQLTDLHAVIAPGARATAALGINDFGTIIGTIETTAGYKLHGTQVTALHVVPGETFVSPVVINDRGQMVIDVGAGAQSGAYFVDGDDAELLPGLPGGIGGFLTQGMNDRGTVVGSAFTEDLVRHATLWQNGALTDLGFPAGFDSSIGRSVNNFNRVAGAAMTNFAGTAATWQNGTWTLLPSIAPGVEQFSDAAGISDLGLVVGLTSLVTESRSVATMWWNGRAFRVDDLVSADDPLKPFVQLESANFVNNRGDLIVIGRDTRNPNASNTYFLRLVKE